MLKALLYISLNKLKKDITTRIIIIVELVLIIFLLNLLIGNWRYNTYILNSIEDMKLDGGYYCSGEINIDTLQENIEIGEIKEAFSKFKKNQSLPILIYNDVVTKHMPLQLSKGIWFNNYTGKDLPIILSATFAQKNNISINQIIELDIEDVNGNIENNYYKVIGILNRPNYYLSFSVAGTNLMWNNILKHDREIGIINNTNLNYKTQNSRFVFTKNTFILDEFKNQVYVTSTVQLTSRTNEYVASTLRQQLIIWLMVFGITLSTIIANNMLEKINEENEFTSYFMLGLSWKSCILIEVFRSIIQLLIACLIGFILIEISYGRNNYRTVILDGYNYLISVGVVFITYFISSLWMVIEFYKTNPIDLLRRNEK